jgi:hypothetical protein
MFINSDIRYHVHIIPPSHPVTNQVSSSSFQLQKLFHDNLLPSMHRSSAWPLESSQHMFCQHLPFAPFLLRVPASSSNTSDVFHSPISSFSRIQAHATAFCLTCVLCDGAGKIRAGQLQLRIPSEASEFFISKPSRPPLGHIHTFIQWLPRSFRET